MPISDPVAILVRQNRWATENMLKACRDLSDEQFHQKFEMGPGSLHDTLTHMLGAMRGWSDLLAGREQRPRLEESGPYTVDQLDDLLAEISDDLENLATSHPTDEIVTGERGGRSWSFTRGGVVTHLTTHGMHHRAQCMNMLRQLGVDPLPPSAVVEWLIMENPE